MLRTAPGTSVGVLGGVGGGTSFVILGIPGEGIHTEAIEASSGRNISSFPSRNPIMNMKKSMRESEKTTCASQCTQVIEKSQSFMFLGGFWK